MPLIAFIGCDGAGKSAVIAKVVGELEQDGLPVWRGHWRPRPFQKEVNREDLGAADDPHGGEVRGLPSSILKLGWLWLNWWIAWITDLRGKSRGGFVIYDRYHEDLVVDPVRYRYGGPRWLARLACRLMPRPRLVIFLDAEVNILLKRKQEVTAEALELGRAGYRSLCSHREYCRVLDAGRPLDEVVGAVLAEIRNVKLE